MLTITRTRAFRLFQRSLGNSTLHINAAYVGLELIARGADKPVDLDINWFPPKQPRQMADQSRNLLHAALLEHSFGVIDSYLRNIAVEPMAEIREEARHILRKSVTKPGGKAYSIFDRFNAIASPATSEQTADGLLIQVIQFWRNQTVHEVDEIEEHKSRVPELLTTDLAQHADTYAAKYGGLDVSRLIARLNSGKSPARKDIVALASAAQNYVRWIDGVVLDRVLLSREAVEALALRAIGKVLLEPDDQPARQLWGKSISARTRRLKAILETAGFTNAESARPKLGEHFIEHIAGLSLADFLNKFVD